MAKIYVFLRMNFPYNVQFLIYRRVDFSWIVLLINGFCCVSLPSSVTSDGA
jgi:hypothetical protein